jgi:hypothetical protein
MRGVRRNSVISPILLSKLKGGSCDLMGCGYKGCPRYMHVKEAAWKFEKEENIKIKVRFSLYFF